MSHLSGAIGSQGPADTGRGTNAGKAAKPGKVYLVGAGPGAADLLTLRAARLIGEADVVLHDALVGPEILALADRATLVDVGKRCGGTSTAQRFICARLVECARRHRVVVRLKGGDPMLFGRAQEEIDALRQAGIDFEIVPGVTAALAAAAQIGAPLTARGVSRSVTFVTPRLGDGEPASEWLRAATSADTTAIYMGGHQSAAIARHLIAHGLPASRPVAIVRNASLPDTRVTLLTLDALSRSDGEPDAVDTPALLLVGEVIAQSALAGQPALATEEARDQTGTGGAVRPIAARAA